ncbi:energy-coupling factor ABC transporter ATP-binding protein [Candidatus Solincola sp.]|jgi:cobalt/nickel transport system ATP-binding protein|nr:ATP-binding cassette domain-containing protein [Actinomycetota bacterium]MDI7251975.1 ATP-binding cassette domain-containing protein [Actinomycetota bacterium]
MHHRPAVEIRGLYYAYPDGTPALRGVDLLVEEGESVGIVGPNGAGKSTLLLHLNGILTGRGEVKIFGLPVVKENLREIRRRVGLVFQDPDDQLFSPTVFDDVAFGPLNMGFSRQEVAEAVERALREVGLTGLERKSAFHLSFGQKKRAAIATVLSMNPDLLVLDEPSSNLDPRARRELSELLQGVKITKVVVTHDLPFVFENCERVVVMDAGKVVADGNVFDILSNEELLQRHGLELPCGFFPLRPERSDRKAEKNPG